MSPNDHRGVVDDGGDHLGDRPDRIDEACRLSVAHRMTCGIQSALTGDPGSEFCSPRFQLVLAVRPFVGERVGLAADLSFQGVAQGIDAGIGGEPVGHAEGQLIVHQGRHRHQAETHPEHFLLGFSVGNDRHPGGL